MREARNGGEILDAAHDMGVAVEIATGEREAELAYLAVTGGRFDKLVCELGSRSMQLAWRQSQRVESIACAAGYECVYSDFIRNADSFAQARDAYVTFLDNEVQRLPSQSDELIGIAMRSMACFVTGEHKAQLTNRHLYHGRIRQKLRTLAALTPADFRSVKANTAKPDKVLSALILLDYMLERTGHERAFIAESELPVGLIVEHFAKVVAR